MKYQELRDQLYENEDMRNIAESDGWNICKLSLNDHISSNIKKQILKILFNDESLDKLEIEGTFQKKDKYATFKLSINSGFTEKYGEKNIDIPLYFSIYKTKAYHNRIFYNLGLITSKSELCDDETKNKLCSELFDELKKPFYSAYFKLQNDIKKGYI